ncbi:hypothetical protein QBC46DRAFT_392026 [Diplogelasinospora grovesii]|uniref:Secreted protein n=1 Tax=Diplogelasinospora grovesii TaxID=303347 RepID=A0AAN6N280_9PEZI|nr:hypothetical protein QBC46DRAFT_392026 [Diplogelasinospora grovesii]
MTGRVLNFIFALLSFLFVSLPSTSIRPEPRNLLLLPFLSSTPTHLFSASLPGGTKPLRPLLREGRQLQRGIFAFSFRPHGQASLADRCLTERS